MLLYNKISKKKMVEHKFFIFSIGLFLSVLIINISCGKQKTEWKGTIKEVDGITIVKNPNKGIWDLKEKVEVSIIKVHQIGQLYGPEEFLFVHITDVTVDSIGDIYVADRRLNNIRKFNKDGEYLLTIGRQGQGPGDFQNIRTISVNNHDDLIVFDNALRRISLFSHDGENIKTTKKLMTDSWISPSKIFVTDLNYVFFGKLSGNLKLFHEFDRDWNIVKSYINYEFIDNKEFEEQMLGAFPGNCFFQNSEGIVYTKYYFDNKIFFYKNNKLIKMVIRESDIKKPYKIQVFHNVIKAMYTKNTEYDTRLFGQDMAFFVKTNQCSLGLFQLSDGLIANFLRIKKSKDLWEMGVELYDSEGIFLKYSKIGENLYYDIRYIDSNDLFYAIDRKEYDKVLIFRLKY